MQLRCIGDLGADREIPIAYGARHLLKGYMRSGPKPKIADARWQRVVARRRHNCGIARHSVARVV